MGDILVVDLDIYYKPPPPILLLMLVEISGFPNV
jgi:hypothetical protein